MSTTHQTRLEDGQLVTAFAGAMTFRDYGATDALLEALFQRIGQEAGTVTGLVFDLAEVEMVDSHWLGFFVLALKRAQESNLGVVLRRPRPAVRRLFDLVQFERVFTIEA